MAISKSELKKTLTGKFEFTEVPGSRHEAVALMVDGKKIATTYFSRSHKKVTDTILTQMARQLWVNLGYLKKMHNCSKSREEYLEHLETGGFLRRMQ